MFQLNLLCAGFKCGSVVNHTVDGAARETVQTMTGMGLCLGSGA